MQGTTKDGTGKVVTSATLTLFLKGTSTPAKIYAAEVGGAAIYSTTSSSTNGYFSFWVDRADYAVTQLFDIVISKSGFTSQTYYAVIIGLT
jgi:hypothetical protein